jgi:hypothetical protein
MNGPPVSFATDPDIPSSPSPVLIAVIVPFFVLLLVVGIVLFIWRRKKRQAILLSSSSSSGSHSSLGSTSDEWTHDRDSTMVGLGAGAASMGSGGAAVPDMTERRKSGNIPVDPFAFERNRAPSSSSSHVSVLLPPDQSPVLAKFSQYPDPGTYPVFVNAPESSSEGHSSEHGRSGAYHYEASVETIDPPPASLARPGAPFASPPSPTTEQSYHTAFHDGRRALSPTQRISAHESIRTPRKHGILRLSILSHVVTFSCRRECPQSVW